MRVLKAILKYLLALFFVLAGLNHFIHAGFYQKIMPPYLPWHSFLVYLSGIFEVGLGLALPFKRFTSAAAWGMIALLVAVFPANIHMATTPELYPEYNPAMLWMRLPLQALFIAWAYWYTRRQGYDSHIQVPAPRRRASRLEI